MSIPSTLTRVSALTDGVSVNFPVGIQAYFATDFLVYLVNNTTGVALLLVLGQDYALAAASSDIPPKWTLTTLAAAPKPAGSSIVTILNPVQTHQTTYPGGGAPLPSNAVQTDTDRLTQMVLRLQDQVNRCIRAPDGDVNPTMLMPPALARELLFVAMDANGNLVMAAPSASVAYGSTTADKFVAVANQVNFNLSAAPVAINNLIVAVNGSLLSPTDDYTLNGNVLTLALPTIANDHVLAIYGQTVQQSAPSAGSVLDASLAPGSLIYRLNKRVVLPYGAAIATDASQGDQMDVVANNNVPFTLSNPTNPADGQRLRYRVFNTSGVALGAVTFGNLFKLGAAWASPATGFNRWILFEYNVTNAAWYEADRAQADIAN